MVPPDNLEDAKTAFLAGEAVNMSYLPPLEVEVFIRWVTEQIIMSPRRTAVMDGLDKPV